MAKPNTNLNDFLDHHITLSDNNDKVNLPLFHNCSQDELMQYLAHWKIVAPRKPCNIFKERIVYTFYGASKFVSDKVKKNASDGDITACLILDSNLCINIHRIYPFDSGAISGKTKELRAPLLKWDVIKEKLNLEDRLSRVNKMILHCYKDLEDYVDAKFKAVGHKIEGKFPFQKTISEIQDTYNLMVELSVADERRFCYEVQFKDELPIMPELLLKFFVSKELMTDNIFKDAIRKYSLIPRNGLYYPSSLETNHAISTHILKETKKYVKNNFLK